MNGINRAFVGFLYLVDSGAFPSDQIPLEGACYNLVLQQADGEDTLGLDFVVKQSFCNFQLSRFDC